MTPTHLPVSYFNAELQRIGRTLDDAEIIGQHWCGDDFGLLVRWPDTIEFISMGPGVSARVSDAWMDAVMEREAAAERALLAAAGT